MVTVLADPSYRGRLRSLDARLLCEPDFVTDRERGMVEHAVAVEVDLAEQEIVGSG